MAPASRNSGGTVMSTSGWGDAPLARALFAYLSSGENQLSFLEGDLIALMGEHRQTIHSLLLCKKTSVFKCSILRLAEFVGPEKKLEPFASKNNLTF